MDALEFVRAHAFKEMDGQYFGMYSDMHLVLKEEGEILCAYLYLDLPPEGRRARRELNEKMTENGERYNAKISSDQSAKGFLKIEIQNDDDAGSNLDRYLTNCDLFLRPFGREMGLLCAYCRSEIADVQPEYRMHNGLVVPVCPDCAHLEGAGKAKKADNRRTVAQRRMTRGVIGAFVGSLISVALWFFAGVGQGYVFSIVISFASVFLIKWMFERFSKTLNRLTSFAVCAFAMLALISGTVFSYTVKTNEYRESMRESAVYLEIFSQDDQMNPDQMGLIDAYKAGDFENITCFDALKDSAYYRNLIVPAISVVIASFGMDSVSLRSRRRR
ncbi:MAG: hypothetical protein IKJ65_01065 [Clostridia bacterium]|nr:hypothetical protein [Clostridia bacterium]